jgi:hypothetical protein
MYLKGEYNWRRDESVDLGPTKWNGSGRASRNQKQVEEKHHREDEPAKIELHLRDYMSNIRREDGCCDKGILPTFSPSEGYIDPTRNITSDTVCQCELCGSREAPEWDEPSKESPTDHHYRGERAPI